MCRQSLSRFLTILAFACCAAAASAQQMSNPYGPPVTLEAAKKIAVPALAEARKNGWTMAVAIVDPAGDLVYFERMDNTQLGSVNTAILKARSSARFKRPSRSRTWSPRAAKVFARSVSMARWWSKAAFRS